MKLTHIAIQSVAAALAVCISLLAAVFAWQQVDVSRIHNRLSVVPILQITPYIEGKGKRNGLYLSNDGLGPAIIKSFSVKSGNVTAQGFESDRWAEVISTTLARPDCFATGWPKGEVAIRAGIEIPLISVTNTDGADACVLDLVKLVGGDPIQIAVEYESIYYEPKQLLANTRVISRTLDALYRTLVPK